MYYLSILSLPYRCLERGFATVFFNRPIGAQVAVSTFALTAFAVRVFRQYLKGVDLVQTIFFLNYKKQNIYLVPPSFEFENSNTIYVLSVVKLIA